MAMELSKKRWGLAFSDGGLKVREASVEARNWEE
jgi:hypothetical protein